MKSSYATLPFVLAAVILSCSNRDDDDDDKLDSDAFLSEYAKAYCEYLDECGGLGGDTGMSVSECTDYVENSLDQQTSVCDGFDSEAADDCLKAMKAASCDESADTSSCSDVYDCSGGDSG